MGRQEAKLERALKELQRLAYNKRCVNCESVVRRGGGGAGATAASRRGVADLGRISPLRPPQGPQYVCTSGSNFAVFVCTVCSGVQ